MDISLLFKAFVPVLKTQIKRIKIKSCDIEFLFTDGRKEEFKTKDLVEMVKQNLGGDIIEETT